MSVFLCLKFMLRFVHFIAQKGVVFQANRIFYKKKKRNNMCIPPERKHRKTNRLLLLRNVLVIFLFVSVTTEDVFLMKHLSSFHVINHISTDKQCNILKYLFPATLYLFLSCPASSPPHFPSIFSTLIS